jgi:hypothetical protein
MPLFHFILRTSREDRSKESLLLSDRDAARREAFMSLLALAADRDSPTMSQNLELEVLDDRANPAFTMKLDYRYEDH